MIKIKNSISRKLLAVILLASSTITFFITVAQVGFDYKQEINEVDRITDLVETGYLPSVTKSLWDMNDAALQTQIAGIKNLPNIAYVEVRDAHKVVASSAPVQIQTAQRIKVFPLDYKTNGKIEHLGTLEVSTQLQQIYSKIYKKIILVFLAQFIKTLLASTLIYIVISRVMTRHIVHIFNYLRSFNLEKNTDLKLDRKAPAPGAEDEFDFLVSAFNQMRTNLIQSYEELNLSKQKLEKKVEENTGTIYDQRRQLEHSAKMSALGEMSGGIAHEINNPLAVIKMRTDQLQELAEAGELDIPQLIQATATISKTSERIGKIIAGLRAFSRDGENDAFQAATIQTVLDDTLNLCREKFRNNGIDLQLNCPKEPVIAECRAVQISQVILNLVNNSFDAIQALPAKWVKIDLFDHAESITIAVTDSGSGIPQKLQEKLMQPFFTTKEIGKGTGLGLSISRSIIKSHHGDFVIDNTSQNTCFRIKLPKSQKQFSENAA